MLTRTAFLCAFATLSALIAHTSQGGWCASYAYDETCDGNFDPDDPPNSYACYLCNANHKCSPRDYSIWQNSTSYIAQFESDEEWGYDTNYTGEHACRIYYQCPVDCMFLAGTAWVCQNPYYVAMDSLSVETQGDFCGSGE